MTAWVVWLHHSWPGRLWAAVASPPPDCCLPPPWSEPDASSLTSSLPLPSFPILLPSVPPSPLFPSLLYPLPAQVVKVKPHDKDAKMKYQECNKIVKQKAFERAIAGDEHKRSVVDSLDIESMSESGPGSAAPSPEHSASLRGLSIPCARWGGEVGLRGGLRSLSPGCCLWLPYLPSWGIQSPDLGCELPVWEMWPSTSTSSCPPRTGLLGRICL